MHYVNRSGCRWLHCLYTAIYLDYQRGHYRHERPVADVRSLNLLVVIRDVEGRIVSEIKREDDSDYSSYK